MCCLIEGLLASVRPKVIIYVEVAQGDIFMEQKMRFGLVFGLVLGQLAILKKKLC